MSKPTPPSDPRLRHITSALQNIPPVQLAERPWTSAAAPRTAPVQQTRVLRVASGLAILTLAAATVALSSRGASQSPTPTVNTAAHRFAFGVSGGGVLSTAARQAFAVFDSDTARPGAAAIKQVKLLTPNAVIDPASFRLAQGNSLYEIIVFGDAENVCAVEREPGLAAGGGCGPETTAADSRTLACGTIEAPNKDGVLLDCLIPNGISNVNVTTPHGTEPLTVINNTVAAILDPKPTSISWRASEGTRREEHLIQ
ncbi:MAG: hypothetical protein ABSB69_14370 [Solirubrobacteraceae bacterium]|jgi:hypothetical protein